MQPKSKLGFAVALVAVGLILVYILTSDGAAGCKRKQGSLRSTLNIDAGWPASLTAPGSSVKSKNVRSRATPLEIQQLLSQVSRDLAPWKTSGITLEMVEKAYCTEEIIESMRIQIVNGSIYLVGPVASYQSRARAMQLALAQLQAKFHLPDVDFVLTTSDKCKTRDAPHRSHDGNMERCQTLAPLFSNDKAPQESQCVTVPDFAFGGWPEAFLPDWQIASQLLSAAEDRIPWEQRQDVIFWRGGDTNEERKILAESELVQSSGMADVHLMSWGGGSEAFARDFISLADHCKYRYLLHVAGVAYSSRLKFLLLCGSAVVFPHRGSHEHIEFWHHMLQDGANILFVDSVSWENMGEPVLKAVKELRSNDTLARTLGRAAKHLATQVLHPDNVERYYMEVLTQYSSLQKFRVTVHPDAVPLETALLRPERLRNIWERTCAVC